MKIVCIFDKLHHKSRNNGAYELRFVSHLIHNHQTTITSHPLNMSHAWHVMCVSASASATSPQPFLIIQIFLSSILIMLCCDVSEMHMRHNVCSKGSEYVEGYELTIF